MGSYTLGNTTFAGERRKINCVILKYRKAVWLSADENVYFPCGGLQIGHRHNPFAKHADRHQNQCNWAGISAHQHPLQQKKESFYPHRKEAGVVCIINESERSQDCYISGTKWHTCHEKKKLWNDDMTLWNVKIGYISSEISVKADFGIHLWQNMTMPVSRCNRRVSNLILLLC